MKNLLCENFFRLVKSMECWLGMFLTALFTVISAVSYMGQEQVYIDEWAFSGLTFVFIFGSAVLGMFFFHDYAEGTLRLKISSGSSRVVFYMADFITSVCYMFILAIIFAATVFLMSRTGISTMGFDSGATLKSALLMAGIFLSNTAIIVLIGMTFKNAFGVIMPVLVNILMTFIMSFVSFGSDNGTIGKIISDMLPQGQVNYLSMISEPKELAIKLLYSVIVTVIATICGIVIFKRSDLK